MDTGGEDVRSCARCHRGRRRCGAPLWFGLWSYCASLADKCSDIYPPWPARSFRSPIVTAARDTPSALATSARVIPLSTMSAHRFHRAGPGLPGGLRDRATRCRSRVLCAQLPVFPLSSSRGATFKGCISGGRSDTNRPMTPTLTPTRVAFAPQRPRAYARVRPRSLGVRARFRRQQDGKAGHESLGRAAGLVGLPPGVRVGRRTTWTTSSTGRFRRDSTSSTRAASGSASATLVARIAPPERRWCLSSGSTWLASLTPRGDPRRRRGRAEEGRQRAHGPSHQSPARGSPQRKPAGVGAKSLLTGDRPSCSDTSSLVPPSWLTRSPAARRVLPSGYVAGEQPREAPRR